jgi:proteic killer suppression protein
MEITFTKTYLQELYEEGKAENKKYRFQKSVVKGYKGTIDKGLL